MSKGPIKIVKVVVDRMPARCGECPFKADEFKSVYEGYESECVALRNKDGVKTALYGEVDEMPYRRHDCPLIVEEAQT